MHTPQALRNLSVFGFLGVLLVAAYRALEALDVLTLLEKALGSALQPFLKCNADKLDMGHCDFSINAAIVAGVIVVLVIAGLLFAALWWQRTAAVADASNRIPSEHKPDFRFSIEKSAGVDRDFRMQLLIESSGARLKVTDPNTGEVAQVVLDTRPGAISPVCIIDAQDHATLDIASPAPVAAAK
jgi:hypothetical protein